MILTIQEQREQIAVHEKENTRLNELVNNLDAQIKNLQRISDLHKQAADDRARALELHAKADEIYKASIDDARKTITKLEKRVTFWQKLCGVAFILGALFGLISRK